MGLKFSRLLYHVTLTALTVVLFNIHVHAQPEKANLQKLTKSSDLILVGKVVKQNSLWNEDKTQIFTRVSIDANEFLKGNTEQKQIIITKPGGEIGDVGEQYSHIPEFEKDEEVLLFLKKNRENRLVVTNGTQGKYTVKKNNASGVKMVGATKSLENYKIKIKSYTQE